jgi:MFS family permease
LIEPRGEARGEPGNYSPWRLGLLGAVAVLILVPVTLPVPVLRGLVQERFAVSETLTSLFMSINMVGAFLVAPLAGALGDRFGRRDRLVVVALLLDALCFLGLTRDVPFWGFMAIRFAEGAAHIFALSLLLALAAESRGDERRGRAMGIAGGGLLLGVAIGAPIGGLLGGSAGPMATLYAGAGVLVLAAAAASAVLIEPSGAAVERPGLGRILGALRAHPGLWLPLTFAFADRFTVGFYTTTFSLYLNAVHGAPPARIGLLIAVFMLPFALLSYPFGRLSERASRATLLCGGSLLYGIGTASLTLWSPALLPFVMASIGVFAAVMFVPSLLLTTELAPAEARSTALGAFNAAGSVGFIVGPLTGGLVSELVAAGSTWETGYRAAFAVAGGSEILLALLAWPAILRLAKGPRSA